MNRTKQALAAAFKSLLADRPFEQVSVAELCRVCGISRKSFYYHFRDKYELADWICVSESATVLQAQDYENTWAMLEQLCAYFYRERGFYRKLFQVSGQNAFGVNFWAEVAAILMEDLGRLMPGEACLEFYADFYADAFVGALRRWISSREPMSPSAFSACVRNCFCQVAGTLLQSLDKKVEAEGNTGDIPQK